MFTTAVFGVLGTIGLLASSIWISSNQSVPFTPTQMWVGTDWSISAQRGFFRDSYDVTFNVRPALITNVTGQVVDVKPPDIRVLHDILRDPRDTSASQAQYRVNAYGWPIRLYVVQTTTNPVVIKRRVHWHLLALSFATLATIGFGFGWTTWWAFHVVQRTLRIPGRCRFCGYSREASKSRICPECGRSDDDDTHGSVS